MTSTIPPHEGPAPALPSAFAHLLAGELASAPLTGDDRLLALALAEAQRGVGRTAPNPPVGAVVARGDEIVATGFHARAGDRHGEVVALDAARGQARGATLYVTLEPCVHHGRTPPCVERVLAEGIARVVIGAVDPNPRVHGHGVAQLRAAGVEVVIAAGPIADACRALIQPFGQALLARRPWVVLKVATSLDGRVAAATGASRWITGAPARALVHALRDAVDVVMVGAGTVVADDPSLTVRDLPLARTPDRAPKNPRRVIVDGTLRTPPSAQLLHARAGEPSPLVFHAAGAAERQAAVAAEGATLVSLPGPGGQHVDLLAALQHLVGLGVTSVLVEAGPGLATALLQGGLVDELWWLTAHVLLGGDGVPAVSALGITSPSEGPRFSLLHRSAVGNDSLQVLKPAARS